MRILGLIPARGGSEGLPKKNIRILAGKPLIQHAYECAVASQALDRVVLSTEATEIADVAKGFGLEVPFVRPPELAGRESAMIDVAIHALGAMEEMDYIADALCILQPTSPLRRPEHIRQAVRLLGDNDSVCSLAELPKAQCPHYLMKTAPNGYATFFMPDGERYTRRQDVPEAYKRDGTIYLTRTEIILKQRTLYGQRCVPMIMPPNESLSIDSLNDWKDAELRLRSKTRGPYG